MNNHKRILFNSSILYLKTAITVIISIFLSRFLLEGLGIRDYGVYNLVGGVIGLMGFVTATLSNSNARFIAVAIGKNDLNNTVSVFSAVKAITKKVVFYIIFVLIIVGIIFVNFILKIPGDRVYAANIVYACMIVNTAYSLLTAPYSALLYSREKIKFLTTLEIIDIFLKLAIAFLLTQTKTDNLILYAVLLMLLSFVHRIVLKQYCIKTELVAQKSKNAPHKIDKEISKSILSFSGWNLLDSIGVITKNQGSIFLVNIFFGVVVNAAYGIATIVNTQMLQFSNSLLGAMRPLVFKSYGDGDGNNRRRDFFTFHMSKIGLSLLSFVIVPVTCEIDFLLKIWLVETPQYTANFIKLALTMTFIGQMSYGLYLSMQAFGRIKEIQTASFVLQFLNFPISFILLKFDKPVYFIYYVAISIEIIVLIVRLCLTNKYLQTNMIDYLKSIIIKPTAFLFTTYLIFNYMAEHSEASLLRFVVILFANAILNISYSYFILFNEDEKQIVKSFVCKTK